MSEKLKWRLEVMRLPMPSIEYVVTVLSQHGNLKNLLTDEHCLGGHVAIEHWGKPSLQTQAMHTDSFQISWSSYIFCSIMQLSEKKASRKSKCIWASAINIQDITLLWSSNNLLFLELHLGQQLVLDVTAVSAAVQEILWHFSSWQWTMLSSQWHTWQSSCHSSSCYFK